MAFCMKCGAELAEGAAFCASCGTAVGTAGTGRKQEYTGVVKKCPNCGEVIPNGLTTKCPSCGFELNKTEVAKGIKEFTDALRDAPGWNDYKGKPGIKSIVDNYVVPNNKEDIVEFMNFALESAKRKLAGSVEHTQETFRFNIIELLLGPLGVFFSDTVESWFNKSSYLMWTDKIKSTVDKDKLLFSNDQEFLQTLDLFYKKAQGIEDNGESALKSIKKRNRIHEIIYCLPFIIIVLLIVSNVI